MTLRTGVSDLHIVIANETVSGVAPHAGGVLISAWSDDGTTLSVIMEPRVIERAYAVLVAEGMLTPMRGTP